MNDKSFVQDWLKMPLNTSNANLLNLPDKRTGPRSPSPYVKIYGYYKTYKTNQKITLSVTGKDPSKINEDDNEKQFSSELDVLTQESNFNADGDIILGLDRKNYTISDSLLYTKYLDSKIISEKGIFSSSLFREISEKFFEYVKSKQIPGLKQSLFDIPPKYIFIDEIDKARYDVQESMLTLMQSGLVSETKVNKTREIILDNTWVIVTANNKDEINPLLADRCIVIDFQEYTIEQFMKIAQNAIYNIKPDTNEELVNYIIERMVLKNIKSVRTAVKVAMMSKTKQDIDLILDNSIFIDN